MKGMKRNKPTVQSYIILVFDTEHEIIKYRLESIFMFK